MSTDETHTGAAVDTETINSTIRYAMWSVFAAEQPLGDLDRQETADEVTRALKPATDAGMVLRGWYDLGGLTADADLMAWWHAPRVEALQDAYHALRRSSLGHVLRPVWSVVGMHRPAEFNRGHVPAFMADEPVGDYICVYPFVRSYDWYLLPAEDRQAMLKEHGMAARPYPDVRANTVSSFGLSDYEWILAFEAPGLDRIVDMMRDLRAVEARRHVREEIPFYTGPRVELVDLVARLA